MKDKTYRQLEEELEELLSRVETGNYEELEQLLKDYKNGKELVKELEKRLKEVKNTVKEIKK